MPTEDFGAYTQGLTANTQVSSTYEGRHITLLEEELAHVNNGTGYPIKGQPVVWGSVGLQGVGVLMNITPTAVTDLCVIDTEGIWNLTVTATDDAVGAGGVVVGGDILYINTSTCVISKINNTATQIPFGLALGGLAQDVTAVIAVKVHYDPSLDTADRMYKTVATGGLGKRWTGLLEAGASEGVCEYLDAQVDGLQTGGIYGWGFWMELQATFTSNGSLLVAQDIGIYDAGATIVGNARIVMTQMMAPLAAAPATFHWFRLNLAAAGGAATAVFATANFASIGYAPDVVINNANKLGNVPLFDDAGLGLCYVEVFSA